MAKKRFVCITDEQAAQLEKMGVNLEVRYVIEQETYDVLQSMFKDHDTETKPKKRKPSSIGPSFNGVEFPANYVFAAQQNLGENTKTRKALDALARRPEPKVVESREELENYLMKELQINRHEAGNHLYYLSVRKNILKPLYGAIN